MMIALTSVIIFLLSALVSKLIENITKIPLPMTLLAISFFIISPFLKINIDFYTVILLVLPLTLISDALHLQHKKLLHYKNEVFYLAVISVSISIFLLGLILVYFLNLPIAEAFAISTIVMATDAIVVSVIIKNTNLIPEKIKFFIESESLFNDATAMIFLVVLVLPLISNIDFTFYNTTISVIYVILPSLAFGYVIGHLFSLLMIFFKDAGEEFIIILLTAYIAYISAELMHFSGILTVIVSIMVFKYFVEEEFNGKNSSKKWYRTTKERMKENEKIIEYISLIAISVLFVSMGANINLKMLFENWQIISIVFLLTTIIRFISMYGTKFVMEKDKKKISFKDAVIMTLGGSKGGLAVLMVHFIPETVTWKKELEIIIFGQVLLSIFVYIPILMFLMPLFYKKENKDGNRPHTFVSSSPLNIPFAEVDKEVLITEDEIEERRRIMDCSCQDLQYMKNNKKISITFTGIDAKTDLFSLPFGVEYGILFSNTAVEKSNRYPYLSEIELMSNFLKEKGHKLALHICGRLARELLIERTLEELIVNFDRLQINGKVSVEEAQKICDLFPSHKIIVQYSSLNTNLHLVKRKNLEFLFDFSGGKGISPECWFIPKEYEEYNFGFAGRLGLENIENELEKILKATKKDFWIDMETKLRDENDFFNVNKAKKILEKVKGI